MSTPWFSTRKVVSSNLPLTLFLNLKFQNFEYRFKFSFYMIQAYQNWSKFYLKLQKEPNIFIMGTRRFFLEFKKTKKGCTKSIQLNKTKLHHFQVISTGTEPC
jgi:hypothetical protein